MPNFGTRNFLSNSPPGLGKAASHAVARNDGATTFSTGATDASLHNPT